MSRSYDNHYPVARNTVSSYSIDDELILFDEYSKQLSRINNSGTVIWKLHNSGLSIDQIASRMHNIYGVSSGTLKLDIVNALDKWSEMGLLANHDNSGNYLKTSQSITHSHAAPSIAFEKSSLLHVKTFKHLDSAYTITASNSQIADWLLPVISHFPHTEIKASHIISVSYQNGLFEITDNGVLIGSCHSVKEVSPIVNARVLVTGYQETECTSVFHAGVVGNEEGVVVLSAGSGSGKSTLTAALTASGVKYFTDEVAVLTNDKTIRPTPGCIGLKTGAWAAISNYYPEIYRLPTHLRQDGKAVKYITPGSIPNHQQMEKGSYAKALVFPKYSPNAKTRLSPITSADALVRLTDAGYHTNETLDHNTVAALVDWVKQIPVYKLEVNDLGEAVKLVKTLL